MKTRNFLTLASVFFFPAFSAVSRAAASEGLQPGRALYTETVKAEDGLVAYWPFNGALKAMKGAPEAEVKNGDAVFVDGPEGGKAVQLSGGSFLAMGATPHLDLAASSVELWFKPAFSSAPGYNPCIIAKRKSGDHSNTRFSLHVWGDYSCLAVWNGSAVVRYATGDVPLQKDSWYHVVLTDSGSEMQLYLNGVLCSVLQGSAVFNRGARELPLSVFSATPEGQELLTGDVAEIAFYNKALCACTIASHTDAMGWKEKRLEIAALRKQRIEKQKALRRQAEAQRRQRREEIYTNPALFEEGPQRVYEGPALEAIMFGVGGIGTGVIQLNGSAEPAVWQIFNNHKHVKIPCSFFAVRVKQQDKDPVIRALQTVPAGPFPPMKELTFRGEYPFAWYDFKDPEAPVSVSMEALNPFIPFDVKNSSIPCALFNVTVENTSKTACSISVLASQQNAAGYRADKPVKGRSCVYYGGNRNEAVSAPQFTVLHMQQESKRSDAPPGDMALAALSEGVTVDAAWTSLKELREQFAKEGSLKGTLQAGPTAKGSTCDGALAAAFSLEPGEKKTVPFVLTWYFPAARHGHAAWGGSGNRYTSWWSDARDVAQYVRDHYAELMQKTRSYHDSFYDSNLPRWLLDRISSQVAVLRSRTCFWTGDGYFGGWEGCCRTTGCCYGNCNHVWHYAQAHAWLFPEIARQLRRQEFRFQKEDGAIPHRQPDSFPAFDGQCGAVLNSYREHRLSSDGIFLAEHWPQIRKAMEYLITTWDKDGDGVLAGAQWNTLDGALGGSSSWLGTLYLAALNAAEEMALLSGEEETAKRYKAIRRSGMEKQNASLFNGEYYIQIPGPAPHEDYGAGCHIDQVLGQWWAHQLELGWLYPQARVKQALASLFKYNFHGTFEMIPQSPRKFVADRDPGLQMITWPKGGKPQRVIRYGDEVMTGFEYAAAAAMIQAGLLREGLAVLYGVSIRYDGRLRTNLTPSNTASWGYSGNPFGDDECGKFYARAMSVWSALLACQGMSYDGPAHAIGFKPVWKPDRHRSFFAAGRSWGLFIQERSKTAQIAYIRVDEGTLAVKTVVLQIPEKEKPASLSVFVGDRAVPVSFECAGAEVTINLKKDEKIAAGQALRAVMHFSRR